MEDQMYRAFAQLEDKHWWFVARRRILGQLVARWVPRGSHLVDVGCGTGGILADLEANYDVVGVDPSPMALEACRRRGIVSVREGTATDPQTWGKLPADAVTLFDVIEHLDDDVGALRAARCAVHPNGRVIVTVPAYQWLWTEHDVANQHRRRYTSRRLVARHRAAGLRPLRMGYFNTLLFPLAVVQRTLAKLGLPSDPLHLPAGGFNRVLRRVFESESSLIAGSARPFPFGLSVWCVSTPDSEGARYTARDRDPL